MIRNISFIGTLAVALVLAPACGGSNPTELFPSSMVGVRPSAGSIADALIAGTVERDGERFSDDVAVLVFRVDDAA